jgi:5-(carboxyamino)imidazole ribonucleotide synthase
MSAQAAQKLGYQVDVLDSDPNSPACQVTSQRVDLGWNSREGTVELARTSGVVTLENEWVSPENLRLAESKGATVCPAPGTLEVIGDKLFQRQILAQSELPTPRHVELLNWADAEEAARQWGYPIVLKSRRGGYDGYGVSVARSRDDLLGVKMHDAAEWYAEEFVPFNRELAVMVAINASGESAVYPVVESRQTSDGHRCDVVVAPAPNLNAALGDAAKTIALSAVQAVGGVGLYGVELFLAGDRLIINEIAPRPHNSGHYTMDGAATSQFEQHIRSIMDLRLGPTDLLAPCVVMANLLAPCDGTISLTRAIKAVLAEYPDVHIHWYGKEDMRTGRKMGHINVLGDSIEVAVSRALSARERFWSDDE